MPRHDSRRVRGSFWAGGGSDKLTQHDDGLGHPVLNNEDLDSVAQSDPALIVRFTVADGAAILTSLPSSAISQLMRVRWQCAPGVKALKPEHSAHFFPTATLGQQESVNPDRVSAPRHRNHQVSGQYANITPPGHNSSEPCADGGDKCRPQSIQIRSLPTALGNGRRFFAASAMGAVAFGQFREGFSPAVGF